MAAVVHHIILLFVFFPGDILIFMPGQEDIEVTCESMGGKFYITYSLYTFCVCIASTT